MKLLALALLAPAAASGPPDGTDAVALSRWMAAKLTWGTLSTTSTRSNGSQVGDAFGNPYSFADVGGVPYIYASNLDASAIDLFTAPGASPIQGSKRERKAPISAVFHSFRLIFGRAIISRNGLEAWMHFPERARAEHSR